MPIRLYIINLLWVATLSFAVSQAVTVTTPTKIIHSSTISFTGQTIERSTHTLLVPAGYIRDDIPPRVNSLVIDGQDVLAESNITGHISATDNISITWKHIREWRLFEKPKPIIV
jgi:hypothetical protein